MSSTKDEDDDEKMKVEIEPSSEVDNNNLITELKSSKQSEVKDVIEGDEALPLKATEKSASDFESQVSERAVGVPAESISAEILKDKPIEDIKERRKKEERRKE